MIYSASSYRLLTRDQPPASLFIRQLVFLLLSWVLLFIIQRTRREILLSKYSDRSASIWHLYLALSSFALFGVSVNGAQRWVSIAGIQFQPSEIVNVGMVLYLAHYFQTAKTLQEMKRPLFVLFLCCVLI